MTSSYVVKINGDYAAALVSGLDEAADAPAGPPFFVVTRLSTLESYRVDTGGAMQAQESLWALDDTYLYWGEMADPLKDLLVVRMVRIPLAKLASVGKPVG